MGLCVTTGIIQANALRILPNETFSASNGWFDRFMKRKRLTIRRITTSGRELPRFALIHINKFLTECELGLIARSKSFQKFKIFMRNWVYLRCKIV